MDGAADCAANVCLPSLIDVMSVPTVAAAVLGSLRPRQCPVMEAL
jgi:hypothetical protein